MAKAKRKKQMPDVDVEGKVVETRGDFVSVYVHQLNMEFDRLLGAGHQAVPGSWITVYTDGSYAIKGQDPMPAPVIEAPAPDVAADTAAA